MTSLQHRGYWLCVVGLCLVPTVCAGLRAEDANSPLSSLTALRETIEKDYENMYLSPPRLLRFGIAFGTGAVMANTHIDRNIQDWYQDHERTRGTDHVAKVAKFFGEGAAMIPVSIGAALLGDKLGSADGDSPISRWGERTARAYLTGAPALLLTQWVTGGDRPDTGDSRWKPFVHDHGVSGHAFIGAVPFITAGRLFEDNLLARYTLYAASALPAWSRINDNAHYASQAFLGWFLAWEAAGAVVQTDGKDRRVSLAPTITADGYGLAL